MKVVRLAFLSAVAGLAPVAHAQISCQQVEYLTDAAADEFDGILGEETETDSVYAATYALGGGSGCQVTYDLSVTYACSWVFDNAAAADESYGVHSHALADCVSEWERSAVDPTGPVQGLTTLRGVSFFAQDEDDAELTWFAYLEEHVEDDTHDWHVWVGLDYF